jgi:hypothetical protein
VERDQGEGSVDVCVGPVEAWRDEGAEPRTGGYVVFVWFGGQRAEEEEEGAEELREEVAEAGPVG